MMPFFLIGTNEWHTATGLVRDVTLNREPQSEIKFYIYFTSGFTIYPAPLS